MIVRLILLMPLLFSAGAVCAQYNPFLNQAPGSCTFTLNTDIHAGSNTLTGNNFFLLRNGGKLEQSTINGIAQSLNDQNIAGGYYDFDYTSIHQRRVLFGKDSVFPVMRMGYHQLTEGSFPREAALVALYGNSPFMGDTVDIAPFYFQELKYFQWKLGLMKSTQRADHRFYSGFAIGMNFGFRNLSVDVRRASLYTAPFGEWISLHSNMTLNMSDYDPSSPFAIKGAGPGLDLFFAWVRNKGGAVAVSLTHLGFIAWNNGYSWKRDSTIRYEGVIIDNIFNAGDEWENTISADTLDKLFVRYGTPAGHFSFLPANLRIDIKQDIKHLPVSVRGSVQYRLESVMLPRVWLCFDWRLLEWMVFSRTHSIGGYGGYTTGFAINARIGKELWINFGATDIYRLVSGESMLNLCFTGGLIYRAGSSKLTSL